MRNRAYGAQRFSIISSKNKSVVAPSLDSLSTGQLSLFNLFSTIIRYADNDDINFSHKINEISGIVVIDEIELHLHAGLQKEILPKLIKLFPKIQFIITSHSPLFLLGMKDVFGEDGFDIIELPSGNVISIEQFSEFENAYRYFINTDKYQKEIADAIDKVVAENKDTALIVTEGSTDWRHMKAAYESLCCDSRCSDWLPNLNFEFFEYDSPDSKGDKKYKLDMGESNLCDLCKKSRSLPQTRKIIFIADRDVKRAIDELEGCNSYKSWGNNVFSFCLPVPEHRKETPDICIEHYYTDDEIKTEVALEDGKKRRLFMGNEFNSLGFSLEAKDDYFCQDKNSCGENKISIIDGSKNRKVVHPREDPLVNYALPKMDFATFILNKEKPFDHMDFSNFIPLFQTIRDILEE